MEKILTVLQVVLAALSVYAVTVGGVLYIG